jgi:general secretion pathway protein J
MTTIAVPIAKGSAPPGRPAAATGFTLVEIVLAITIMALVVSMMLGAVRTATSSAEIIGARQRIRAMGRMAVQRLAMDLDSILPADDALPAADEDAAEESPFRIEGRNGGRIDPTDLHLRFATRASQPGKDARAGRPLEIVYYLAPAQPPYEGPFVLKRADRPYPFEDFETRLDDPVLCEAVETMQLTFYDADGDDRERWDAENDDGALTAVGLQINLVAAGRRDSFRTRIVLPVTRNGRLEMPS